MSKKLIYIFGGVLVCLVGALVVFVFKAQGSSDLDMVSGCVPYNVSLSKGEDDHQVVIDWKTEEECLGYVIYGDDMGNLDLVSIDTKDLSSEIHTVVLEKLLSTKYYYFVISSGGMDYGDSGVPLSFSLSSLQ
ncbi:hypothetical protein K8R20_03035 [bacterium]|nr:hypothetical protein [bacterium]